MPNKSASFHGGILTSMGPYTQAWDPLDYSPECYGLPGQMMHTMSWFHVLVLDLSFMLSELGGGSLPITTLRLLSVYARAGAERHVGVLPVMVRGLHLRQLQEDAIRGAAPSL